MSSLDKTGAKSFIPNVDPYSLIEPLVSGSKVLALSNLRLIAWGWVIKSSLFVVTLPVWRMGLFAFGLVTF